MAINQTKFINFRQKVIDSNLCNLSNFYYKIFQQLSYFLYHKGLIYMLPAAESGIFDDVIITLAILSDT